jgi:hypothetical protein
VLAVHFEGIVVGYNGPVRLLAFNYPHLAEETAGIIIPSAVPARPLEHCVPGFIPYMSGINHNDIQGLKRSQHLHPDPAFKQRPVHHHEPYRIRHCGRQA